VSGSRGLWVAAALCGLLAACATRDALYSTPTRPVDRARVHELLRDIPGLPEGFSIRPRAGWRPPVSADDEKCRQALAAVAGHPPKPDLRAHAEVTFHGAAVGELAGAAVAGYRGDADAAFHAIERALDGCDRIVGTKAVAGTRFKQAELPIADIGQESLARRLRGRLNGYPYEMHLVYVRADGMLISVVHTGMGRVEPARTERLARAVTAKMTGEAE
jgi:hypothetical protein